MDTEPVCQLLIVHIIGNYKEKRIVRARCCHLLVA